MVDENMANAARVHTVENGRDIENFTMIAFGGGAPLHACRLCEKLDIQSLLIPPGAGVGSAIGFLRAPFSYEATKGLFQRLDEFEPDVINRTLSSMQNEAQNFVHKGAPGEKTITKLTAFMRYSGQGWEIPVSIEFRVLSEEDLPEIQSRFEEAYELLFGRTIEGLAVEITNWSLIVATKLEEVSPIDCIGVESKVDTVRIRSFYDAAKRGFVEAKEVERKAIQPGNAIEGPAVIMEQETSTIVTSSFRAIGQLDGSLLITRKEMTK